jgi:hypothetical protein
MYISKGHESYEVAAFIQVISAFVMFKSRPAKELMTVMDPVRKLVMATAMVTDAMNMLSWNVDVKHSGRALGSRAVLIGCSWERVAATTSASVSVSAPIFLFCLSE